MKVLEITPVLVVDRIEPSLDAWTKHLGFDKPVEVPHEDTLGFVALTRDGHPVMMQTRRSVAADSQEVSDALGSRGVVLYVDVDSLEDAMKATKGLKRVMDVRETFYGAREFGVADPSGHVMIFGQKIEK
jgi:uncharacterized glyoxalase superfamily protein PhnB